MVRPIKMFSKTLHIFGLMCIWKTWHPGALCSLPIYHPRTRMKLLVGEILLVEVEIGISLKNFRLDVMNQVSVIDEAWRDDPQCSLQSSKLFWLVHYRRVITYLMTVVNPSFPKKVTCWCVCWSCCPQVSDPVIFFLDSVILVAVLLIT